jgi:hypothetical protein
MSDIDIGYGYSTPDLYHNSETYLDTANPANGTGTLNTFQVYFLSTGAGFVAGTFYGSGTSYTNRAGVSIGAVTSGSVQTFTGLSCAVTTGDFLGCFWSSGHFGITQATGGTQNYWYATTAFGQGTLTFTAGGNPTEKCSAYATGSTAPAPVTLTVSDCSHVLASDNIALVSQHILSVANASHNLTSDNIALVQHNTISVGNASHNLTSDNIGLIQQNTLSISNASHNLTSDNITLSGIEVVLSVNDATHNLTSDDINLIQQNILSINNAVNQISSDSLNLIPNYLLAMQNASHNLTSDDIVLSSCALLSVADAVHALTSDNIKLQVHGGGLGSGKYIFIPIGNGFGYIKQLGA